MVGWNIWYFREIKSDQQRKIDCIIIFPQITMSAGAFFSQLFCYKTETMNRSSVRCFVFYFAIISRSWQLFPLQSPPSSAHFDETPTQLDGVDFAFKLRQVRFSVVRCEWSRLEQEPETERGCGVFRIHSRAMRANNQRGNLARFTNSLIMFCLLYNLKL